MNTGPSVLSSSRRDRGVFFLSSTIAMIGIGTLIGLGNRFSVAGAILLCALYVFGAWICLKSRNSVFTHISDGTLIAFLGALHALLILSAFVAGAPNEAFWVPDAFNQHLPRSENMAAFLRGEADLRGMHVIWDKFYLAQITTGIGFAVFGKSPLVSSLAMVFIKIMASFFVVKSAAFFQRFFSDARIKPLTLWLFAFNPMVIFHTSVFYKESGVYLVVALLGYCLLKVMDTRNWSIGLAASLLLLLNERFYFGVFYAGGIMLAALTAKDGGLPKRLKYILVGFGLAISVIFIYFYSGHISLLKIWDELHAQRVAYLSYNDVSDINKTLWYPLAVLKLFFSPYFTPGKVAEYDFFAQLIPWGAILHQCLLLLGLIGLLRAVLTKGTAIAVLLTRSTLAVLTAFILMFGYVAPYAGRLRDSMLPILLIYSCVELVRLFDRTAARNKIKTAAA